MAGVEAMASFFSGTPLEREARVRADISYMREAFAPWRARMLRLKEMLLPALPSDKQALNASATLSQKMDDVAMGRDQPSRAHVRTAFVHTGSTAIINRMDRSEIIIETNMNARNDAEMEKSDLYEDFNTGIVNVLNYEYSRAGEGTSFVRRIYESIVNNGKAVTFVQMKEGKGGIAVPHAEVYDPFACFHTFRGPVRRFGYDMPKSAEEIEKLIEDARSLYGTSIKVPDLVSTAMKAQQALIVTYHWLEELINGEYQVWRSLFVGDSMVYQRETDFKRMPIIITSTNSISSAYRQVQAMAGGGANSVYSVDVIENHAEPWFSPIENAIGEMDTLLSLELAATHLMAFPPIAFKDEDGVIKFAQGGKLHTPGATIYLTEGQAVAAVDTARSAAAEFRHMAERLQVELEYALPPSVRGQSPFAGASGYLVNQLTDQQKNAIVDVFAGGSVHLKGVLQELNQQFVDDGTMKIRLDARVPSSSINVGRFYTRDFSVEDVPEDQNFTVVIDPMVAENDAAKAQLAISLTQASLMAPITAMGTILKLRHPLQETRRLQAAQAEASPAFQEIRLQQRFQDEIAELTQRIIRAQRERRDADAVSMRISRTSLEFKLEELEQKGLPQTGSPQKPNGFSTDVLPSQETGANPQEAAAAEGRPSVGMGGQSGTGA